MMGNYLVRCSGGDGGESPLIYPELMERNMKVKVALVVAYIFLGYIIISTVIGVFSSIGSAVFAYSALATFEKYMMVAKWFLYIFAGIAMPMATGWLIWKRKKASVILIQINCIICLLLSFGLLFQFFWSGLDQNLLWKLLMNPYSVGKIVFAFILLSLFNKRTLVEYFS